MEKRVEIAIENFLQIKSQRHLILNPLFRYHSYYKLNFKGDKNPEIIFFINNEFKFRQDHLKSFELIYEKLKSQGYRCLFISAKRKLYFFKGREFKDQFHRVYNLIENQGTNLKKFIVFCDSVPLQTYLVEKFNLLNIETFSLQHGFYPEDNNDVFKKVYQASNAKNFFVWDKRTLKYMKKYNPDRKYIKTGPHYKSNGNSEGKIKAKNKIAIYSCGKDQIKENIYLSRIYSILQEQSISCILIAHPKITLFEKVNFYLKHKVWMSSNSKKKYSYTNSLILNSSVYLELKEQGENYFILNEHYLKNSIPKFEDYFSSKKDKSSSMLEPFQNPQNAIKTIIKTLSHDL